MSEALSNNIICAGYLLLWILTFIGYHILRFKTDGGSAIMLTYIIYAIFSLFSINDFLFGDMYLPLTVLPFIYLYLMLMIALSPAIYVHFHPTNKIEDPNSRIPYLVSIIIIITSFLLLPDILSNFADGFVKLFTDVDAGKDAYSEQIEEVQAGGGSGISNLTAIIYNSLMDFPAFMTFYFLTKEKKNVWLISGLFFAVLVGLLLPIMRGQRGGVVMCTLTLFLAYMMYRNYLSAKVNKFVKLVGIILVITVSLPIAAITISRFGSDNVGPGVGGYINWYVGQGNLYFNNYAFDNGGIRYGDRTINLFKRIVYPDTPQNYDERRWKYRNLNIDDNLFTTFVGDFVIDFGPILATVIFIVFSYFVLVNIRTRGDTIKLHQLVLLYFSMCICMQGGMTLFSFSDTSNLRIITIGLFYSYLRYHDVLLERYPLK